MLTLPERIRRQWPRLAGPGVIAVSGGADSVALARLMTGWAHPLTIAHINHQLRGLDADADEQFVRELASTLGLPKATVSIDVAGEAKRRGLNLEDAARRCRYDWLAQLAQETGSTWIATGHTADDQAETVLHRLLRGTGIQGLRGIAREREIRPGLKLIRPLLGATRAQVVRFLNSIGQTWREDASNREPIYTRNRIRHELLPLLQTFNPAVVNLLCRLAVQADELHQIVEREAQALLAQAELPAAGNWRIFRADALNAAQPRCLRAMFRLLWQREGWPQNDMSFAHWNRLVELATGAEKAIDLPGGVRSCFGDKVVKVGLTSPRE